MLKKINEALKLGETGIKMKDIDWKKIIFKLRQAVAIIPRLIALPFFIFGIVIVIIAIIPANIAEALQKLANRVER